MRALWPDAQPPRPDRGVGSVGYGRHQGPCTHPEHHGPRHLVVRDLTVTYCPDCGHQVTLRPPAVTW